MRKEMVSALMVWVLQASCTAQEISVRIEPSEAIYVNETSRRLGMSDIMVQTIALVNDSDAPVTFKSIVLEAMYEGETVLTDRLSHENYEPVWNAYYPIFADPEVQKSQDSIILFSRVLPEGVTISPSLTLDPGTAFLIRNRALVFSSYLVPDTLYVRATAVDAAGRTVTAEATRRIMRYEQKNNYIFPLEGRWYISSSSSLRSHHRLRLGHEFALDLMKIGAGGKSFRTDGSTPTDYYAFGKGVHAIADGTVVAVEADVQDTEMPRPGESRGDFAGRVLDAMWEEDPTGHIAGGNYVVIAHGGREHSAYVHLKHRSVTVKTGDKIKQGQKIGEVGISGDGFEPHLHFSVMDGQSMSYAQGLPVKFTNVQPVGFSSTLDMKTERLFLAGEFLETVDPGEFPD